MKKRTLKQRFYRIRPRLKRDCEGRLYLSWHECELGRAIEAPCDLHATCPCGRMWRIADINNAHSHYHFWMQVLP